jgi:DNA-binding MarR family transcriptional regulator
MSRTTVFEYRALANVRFFIRRYLNNTERAARSVGLEPQQYVGLLHLRGLPAGQQPTIGSLAERLQVRHHSAVELVDRMEERGLFRRERSEDDRRHVLVRVTPRGEKLLHRLVRHRISDLRETGPDLVRSLGTVMEAIQRRGHGRPQRGQRGRTGNGRPARRRKKT